MAMKTLMLTPVFLIFSMVANAQIIEVEFDKFIAFNSGKVSEYEELLNPKNYVVKEDLSGFNKYVIDLTDRKMYKYLNNEFKASAPILSVKKEKGLIYLVIEDTESSTGKKIPANVVLNTDKNDKKHPKYLHYFLSTVTNTINGRYSCEYSIVGK